MYNRVYICVCVLQNVELVDDVQKAILQLQAECEKLHESSRSLQEDSRQRQTHIEVDRHTNCEKPFFASKITQTKKKIIKIVDD